MGTGRKFNKKPATRPVKNGADRKRREEVHKKRLQALGVDEAAIKKMTTKRVRELLKYPEKTRALVAKENA